jgi:3-oxoacyl-[acyl-carrier protein] reductase
MANVIVTGGSRGIGLAIVQTLAVNDYTVVAIARQETKDFVAARERSPDSIYSVPFDLSQTGKLHELARGVRERFGPIYGLINNAGLGTEGILATLPESSIEKLIELNTLAPIILTKYVVRSMLNEGAGRVVNISSIMASTGSSGLSVYGATKASMIGFTKSLAAKSALSASPSMPSRPASWRPSSRLR